MTCKPLADTSHRPRLRMNPPSAPLHIVLVNPEIPQNTGNIARICAATGAHLHLVGTLGFAIDDKAVRRAGLDYWHLVRVFRHDDFDAFLHDTRLSQPPLLFTTAATTTYLQAPFHPGCALIFGAESCGLPDDITAAWPASQYGIPTLSRSVRSLNLSNAVSIATYKALEITGAFHGAALGV